MMISMRTATRRVVNNHKHKRCKTRITKIKIMTSGRLVFGGLVSYSEERREGQRRST